MVEVLGARLTLGEMGITPEDDAVLECEDKEGVEGVGAAEVLARDLGDVHRLWG